MGALRAFQTRPEDGGRGGGGVEYGKTPKNVREELTGMSDANEKQSIQRRATPSCCATLATRVLLPEEV